MFLLVPLYPRCRFNIKLLVTPSENSIEAQQIAFNTLDLKVNDDVEQTQVRSAFVTDPFVPYMFRIQW